MTNDECETGHSAFSAVFSSGASAIDRLLPGGGLRHGMLVEWLSGRVAAGGSPALRTIGEPPVSACGAATLSLLSAREACRAGGTLVVIDRQRTFYPPAAAAWGVDLERLIMVRPTSARDQLWAAVQALRSPVVAAVWGAIPACREFDSRALRRLQLAAQAGRTLGLFLRPASARGQPTWADVQLGAECPWSVVRGPWNNYNGQRTTDYGRLVQIHVLRMRGGRAGGSAILEIDDAAHAVREVVINYDAHPLPVVAKLADSAARSRSARA